MLRCFVAANGLDGFLQLVVVTIIFIIVLFACAYTTKWIGKLQKQKFTGRNLEVIESMVLPGNKIIEIIRTGDEYVVAVVCKDTVTLLNKLQKEQLDLTDETLTMGQTGVDFSAFLDKFKNKQNDDIKNQKINDSNNEKEVKQ